ncbi:hypothetical protein PVAP13_5NG350481 [Panicum virgatum]|uniref:Meg domain-containing protein n=1 Tax=Panicum virgatum TaxID=38727 RepID=A0A8T0RU23_PANVG|nr:hypothetical protein PVAP13_5NG350481 [Panicum virgatum]
MEGHKMQNGTLVLLSLLVLGCFSIHVTRGTVMDEMSTEKDVIPKNPTCYHADDLCKLFNHDFCWCCLGGNCYTTRSECKANCHEK